MSFSMWIVLIVGVWLFGAVAVGLLVGRMVRVRDGQLPGAPRDSPLGLLTDPADGRYDVWGAGDVARGQRPVAG